MNRTTHFALVLMLALSVTGCGTGRRIRYYTIQVPPAPTPSTSVYPVSLLVGSITAPQIFRDTPIAYRIGPNELGTYQQSRWAEPAVEMVKAKLIRVLSTSGNYQSVAGVGSTSAGQFVVRGKLFSFEEVDGGNIAGVVSMEFELYDRKSGKVVWSQFYSQSEPASGKKISDVVAALDINLDRGLKEIAAGLGQYFSVNFAGKS